MVFYGGFVDGKLNWIEVDDGFGGHNWRHVPAIFKRRHEARAQYEDVRRIEVKEERRKASSRNQQRGMDKWTSTNTT